MQAASTIERYTPNAIQEALHPLYYGFCVIYSSWIQQDIHSASDEKANHFLVILYSAGSFSAYYRAWKSLPVFSWSQTKSPSEIKDTSQNLNIMSSACVCPRNAYHRPPLGPSRSLLSMLWT